MRKSNVIKPELEIFEFPLSHYLNQFYATFIDFKQNYYIHFNFLIYINGTLILWNIDLLQAGLLSCAILISPSIPSANLAKALIHR